jgi:ribosomal protein S27AE
VLLLPCIHELLNKALVVFMLEYGLTFLDIVNKRGNTKQHLVTPIHEWPKELNQFVADNNQKDLQLWEIANKRLDEKVALLKQRCGAAVFAAHLETFRHLQGAIQMQCADPKLCEMQGISNSSNRYKFERLTCYRCGQSH